MRRLPPLLLAASILPLSLAEDAATQGRGPRRKVELVKEFDVNGDGWLNRAERQAARKGLAERQRGGRGGRRGPRGNFGGRGGRDTEPDPAKTAKPKKLTPDTVAQYPDHKLYDAGIIRTLFLEFEHDDWNDELKAFHKTDVDVDATLTVDGQVYRGVGVRYRGNTSFRVGEDQKKSINLVVDLVDRKQRLYGYKTLNLLNCHTDASFLREVVFGHVCREYMPHSRTNYVRVVINGENYGIYANIQQINKEFLRENYNTRKGIRWKVPPNFSGDGGLRYLGENVADYKTCYDLKNKNAKEPWKNLIRICYLLEFSNDKLLEDGIWDLIDADEVLWHLALDNIFQDGDGYHSRASDYILYEDPKKRLHLLFHDNNEVMRAGGGRGGRGRGGRGPGGGGGGVTAGPLDMVDREDRPLLYRMLALPSLRARYLAHMRTILDEWFDWEKLGPVARRYHELIDEDVKYDKRRLYSYAQFQSGLEGRGSLKEFVDRRREALLAHADMQGPAPTITSVEASSIDAEDGMKRLHVKAQVGQEVPVEKVILYVRDRRLDQFTGFAMFDDGKHGDGAAGDGVFGGASAPFKASKRVRYYVEARAPEKVGTTVFHPRKAAGAALRFSFGSKQY